jgi:simple sugar transport system substrate-binding protein
LTISGIVPNVTTILIQAYWEEKMKSFVRSVAVVVLLAAAVTLLFTGCSGKKSGDEAEVKAGFIYVGPIGDFGWSHAHDQGRLHVEEKFPWLETVYVESVPEGDAARIIDRLVQEEKCDIVFTTSFGFMDDTIDAGERYPDTTFMHCSGFKQTENVGTYFGDLYQAYYLNGIMAGSLTKSDKIGYVAAFPISELVRHINAYALGVKVANPDAEVHVRWTYAWYGPDKAKEAAEALIAEGCDALAFTEDTPAVIEVGQDHTERGNTVYTFSHYSPMQSYGVDSVVSGQLSDWGIMYEKILDDYYNDKWSNEDLWWLMKEKATYLGAEFDQIINPKFVDDLRAVDIGDTTAYDLIVERLNQMTKGGPDEFDPFEGPIYDNKGTLQIPAGSRASKGELLSMMYFVDNVVGDIPSS